MTRAPDRPIRSSLSERVVETMRRHGLIGEGTRVAIALSGGGDSVALLHLLREIELGGSLTVAGVAHFNHQLRGPASDGDEEFCRRLAAELSLPTEVGSADVRTLAREQGRSIEDAARVARYAFLAEAADRLGAQEIAVAHNREDQAETFLLRLIRGAGPRGLAAIHPRAGRVVRPLLDITRGELRAYLAERRLEYRNDATNTDVSIPRNRVRHELIPYLQREFSPGIVDVLAREAAIARDDENVLQAEASDLASTVVLRSSSPEGRLELDTVVFRSVHPALASRVVRNALAELAGGRFVGFEHVEAVLDFARNAREGAALSLPGQQVVRRGDRLLLRPESRAQTEPNSFRFPLSIPGEVVLISQGWRISAEPGEAQGAGQPLTARGQTVPVAADALELPLAVRSRRPGDRFKPLGLGGSEKKLQDFLVDRKVPRDTRDALPLVVDGSDRIVWVVGQSVSETFRVTEPSQGVILLKARRLGGDG